MQLWRHSNKSNAIINHNLIIMQSCMWRTPRKSLILVYCNLLFSVLLLKCMVEICIAFKAKDPNFFQYKYILRSSLKKYLFWCMGWNRGFPYRETVQWIVGLISKKTLELFRNIKLLTCSYMTTLKRFLAFNILRIRNNIRVVG